MATPQTQASQVTNGLIAAAQQLMQLYNTLQSLDAEWTDDGVANTLSKMSTVALNADGSIGAADTSPNTAHPIDPKYNLTQALSSTQIEQVKSILDGVVSYVGGQAVTTQPGARAILNAAVGG